jgi:hypothetical protein
MPKDAAAPRNRAAPLMLRRFQPPENSARRRLPPASFRQLFIFCRLTLDRVSAIFRRQLSPSIEVFIFPGHSRFHFRRQIFTIFDTLFSFSVILSLISRRFQPFSSFGALSLYIALADAAMPAGFFIISELAGLPFFCHYCIYAPPMP